MASSSETDTPRSIFEEVIRHGSIYLKDACVIYDTLITPIIGNLQARKLVDDPNEDKNS